MNEKQFSIVIPCMGRARHVLQLLPLLKQWAEKIIVVDYNCPDRVGELLDNRFPNVEIVRERSSG